MWDLESSNVENLVSFTCCSLTGELFNLVYASYSKQAYSGRLQGPVWKNTVGLSVHRPNDPVKGGRPAAHCRVLLVAERSTLEG